MDEEELEALSPNDIVVGLAGAVIGQRSAVEAVEASVRAVSLYGRKHNVAHFVVGEDSARLVDGP